MGNKKFRILSIDGGGIRGIYPAFILQCIQDRLGIDIYERFDLIAGTSTGSIIAAALASKINASRIVSLYQNNANKIFGNKISSFWPNKLKQGSHSKYEISPLSVLLEEEFGDLKMGEIEKPLLIPATDIGNGGVHIFKSNYSTDFTRDKKVAVKDAVLASCSAPAYFDPSKVDNYLLSDGGLWANNPALAAMIDAQHRMNINIEDIRVLSLGTGQSITAYGTNTDRKWGLLRGWKSIEFISFILSLQAQSTHNYLKLILSRDQLLRINFESDNPLPLDDLSILDNLISRADRSFTYECDNIKDFFVN